MRTVIGGELSSLRRLSDDLPDFLPGTAGHAGYPIPHLGIPRIGGPITFIGHLITQESRDITVVCGRIPDAGNVPAVPGRLPALLSALVAALLAAVVGIAAAAAGQVAIGRVLILIRGCLIAIGRSLIGCGPRLLEIRTHLIDVRAVLVAVRGRLFEVRTRPVTFSFTCCGHLIS